MPDSAALNATITRGPAGGAGLHPHPDGWFAVGFTSELGPGAVLTRPFMGREVVLYRTASGRAVAVDAHCPHMGAHFGHGGAVAGETLRCPFHHFCFDADGRCVSTPYRRRLPQANLRTWPLRERHGVLLVHHDHQGRAPAWEVPALDTAGWSLLRHGRLRARSHPQETSENGVDLGHFSVVHGYEDVELLDLHVDGHYLRSRFAFQRRADFLGRGSRRIRVEFEAHLHGLGYSVVEVHVPAFGLRTRQFVLATPADAGSLDLRLALCVKTLERSARLHWLLGPVPPALLTRLVAWSAFKAYVHDVEQDVPIWEHKQYVHPPRLAEGDGPVGRFRRWARQFYPEGRSLPEADDRSE
jgi:nitrite reductase/ring-hydroxylating ferredoxin subunit